jgi:hypothetical protein
MKEAAVFDKAYVKKSAWVGADNFPYEFQQPGQFLRPRISRF